MLLILLCLHPDQFFLSSFTNFIREPPNSFPNSLIKVTERVSFCTASTFWPQSAVVLCLSDGCSSKMLCWG